MDLKFVNKCFYNTYEEKKSKFIAYILPYSEFTRTLSNLKEKHPKARHFVYAYRYLNEFDQIVENSSDDGEPRGTSGRPSLAVISGAGIINTAVIIIRYFVGVKLGTGGLVRAYSSSVNEVISLSEFSRYKKLELKQLFCDYSQLSKIEYLLEKDCIKISKKEFLSEIVIHLEITKEEWEVFVKKLPNQIRYI